MLTPLCKQGIPVLRYRTHDLTAVHTEPCACGRTLARMDKVRSRSDDMLIIRGTNVFPSQIEDVLTGIEEVTPHYHIIVETRGGMDALIVETELRPEAFRDSFEAMDALARPYRREAQGHAARGARGAPGRARRHRACHRQGQARRRPAREVARF